MLSIGIVVPTNNPKNMETKFVRSLEHISEIQDRTKILINFQPPYTQNIIDRVVSSIQEKGYDVDYVFDEEYDKPIKIALIRERCALLDPNLNTYMIADDNFKFSPGTTKSPYSSGQRYLEALEYMEKFPNCGGVQCMGFLGGYTYGRKIRPAWNYWFGSRQGLILRNIKDELSGNVVLAPSEEFLELRGGLEELMYPYARMERGYFMSKQMNVPTVHIAKRMSKTTPEDMQHPDVFDNNIAKYIRDRYDQPNWKYNSKKSPKELKVRYLENKGDPEVFKKENEYVVDFGESS